jgi:uncharacterized repeat protein (TIGR01451 family)
VVRSSVVRVFSQLVLLAAATIAPAVAQPLLKSAIQVDPGNTKPTGQTFGYRLTYNCSSTSGPCLGAQVVDLLPAEVAFVSTVPASPTGDVAAINVTPNFMGTGRTRVQFVLINPLPAGNSGDLVINVRFNNGSTPDGTAATNTADGINLDTVPGTLTTPPVTVTAVATVQVTLEKTLTTGPANLDLPETYRLRIAVPNSSGALNLTAIGPVVDTLPPGAVFNGATPAADCQPGCVGTTPVTVTWTAPCAVPLAAGGNCDIQVNVVFPSATFPSGTNVTNSFTADATPLGEPAATFGPGSATHPVTTFVPNPSANLGKDIEGGSPNPPTLDQTFSYELAVGNNGNVALDTLVVIDTLPVELQLLSVTTGAYSGLADFAAGEGVRVSYEENTAPGVFTLWGSSPGTATSTTLTSPPPGLGAGEYVTRVRWEYGQAQPGMSAGTRPRLTGRIVNPDNAGGPVAIGDTIQNCADLTAVYTAGPTNVSRNACRSFVLSGPFVQLNPAKENLSGGGPFNPGQTVAWRLRVRSDARSSDPVPLEDLVATDLLPVNLVFSAWTFDDRSTGLPAPQVFEQIPNFAGTGRTLLRWRWNAGSGDLAVGQEVWINVSTTVRSGALAGNLSNDFTFDSDPAGLAQRCTGSSQADALDLDGDGDTAETLCRATGTITVAGIAQLVSGKTIRGTCDGGFGGTSSGTLIGGAVEYRLRVQNVGTVPMQDFVLVDILPFVGDTGVRDTNPRGSQWTPLLASPIIPPPGTTLYYSTSGNPCRGEVGGPVAGCDPPNWTTVPPVPITSVRAFKVEFGDRVVQPFDFLEFTFLMTAPGNLPLGATAFNSFAYQAERGDGLGSLAAEPQKVGITLGTCEAAGLGDFVWLDPDGDGVQNGPTGVNDVFVQLFTPGADGLPGTVDDVPLASAITGPGPDNAPGWYNFPGLAAGSYLVCATAPPTYDWTVAGQGTEATDSDADPATGCSAVVTLGADEQNPDVDFGLVSTQRAALGNYVWFDRNNDGLQNQPQTDGANGVTVRLWVDDGDGTPEPGGGDALVATTVTADDPFGQPGFYLFDGLIPGLRYFAQFVLPASATGFTGRDAGGDDTIDSDADLATGATGTVILAPDEVNLTLDAGLVTPTGTLALGDQVWFDTDDDGVFEPENGEAGIDNVRLDLYLDDNGDGEPTLDEAIATTSTATASGFAGRYRFDDLAPGPYIVVVAPSSFAGGGALAGLVSSTGNDPAPDPDDDVNGDDNGAAVGALTASRPVTLTDNGEPTAEDGNNDTNLTVDFGFVTGGPGAVEEYDYGDAPDVVAGAATADYNTTALDLGAYHLVDTETLLFLGACVDADDGFNQDPAASGDDTGGFGIVAGTCASGNDDEDGVTFTGPFTPGGTAAFTVTAGGDAPCALDAWVDWNQSGVFGDSAGEQIAAALNIPTGAPTVLNPAVPASALPGLTYARFRCSSTGGLAPTGLGGNGEVEDYLVAVVGTDFGDAPASYGTQGAGAAIHTVDPLAALFFGSCVDTEADGQPDASAAGDDQAAGTFRVGSCFDDEDGIAFVSVPTACQTSQVSVTATMIGSGGGLLDAWIDWNADGDFGDAGEQVFTSQPVIAGTVPLSLTAPCTAVEGTTYARFRLSTAGGLDATGAAADGEVEDLAVNVGAVDFGDAPDSYGTLLASNGPNHGVTAGFSLGATVDTESQGQPSVGATGDGADEDGVTLPGGGVLVACSSVSLTVTLTNTAGIATPRLDAWIDFDGDGAFGDPRDRIVSNLALASGANSVPVNVPCDARSVASYARFRLSDAGVAGPGGPASVGEVEDWAVTLLGLDFGDAPDPTYPTLLASNGARHAVLPVTNPTLGPLVDTEPDGQAGVDLSGDDATGANGDDEDGVTFPATYVPGTDGTVELHGGATGGLVSCWIDWNRDGDWNDPGEQVATDLAVGAGATVTPTFGVPVGSPQGTAPTRCRISTAGGLGVTGLAADGEVEDHPAPVGVELPQIGIAKQLVSSERDPGNPRLFTVTFEVTLENLGNVPLSDVNATAAFGTVFPAPVSFTVLDLSSATFTVSPAFDGQGNVDLLAAGNSLPVGASGVIQIVLRIDTAGERGPFECSSTARATSPAGVPVTDMSQDGDDPDPDADGDAGDNDDPTVLLFQVSVIEVPTLGEWGLLALIGLLGLAGAAVLRRRRGVEGGC